MIYSFSVLTKGSLDEHKIVDGTKLTLLPAVESGFSVSILCLNVIYATTFEVFSIFALCTMPQALAARAKTFWILT